MNAKQKEASEGRAWGAGYFLRGEITVFLSLILLTMLSLLFGLLESARVQAARAQCLAGAQLGMFSLFGEYDRDLLEEYEVFFLDGGCGQGKLMEDVLCARLKEYAGENIAGGGFLGTALEQTGLTAVLLASDEQGAPFFYQAVSWIREELLFLALDGVTKETEHYLSDAGSCMKEGTSLMEQADQVSGRIEELREAARKEAEEAYEAQAEKAQKEGKPCTAVLDLSEMEFENPIDTLKRYMEAGILGIAAGEKELSSAAVRPEELLGGRSRQTGFGSFNNKLSMGSTDGLLFDEYILRKLPSFLSEDDGPGLCYQTEYVLAGKSSDRENLETVLERLLLIRFGLNFAFLLSSGDRQLQAEAVAAGLCTLTGFPVLTELMKTAVLLLWAYEESLTDIRTLLCKGKVPFFKSEETFSCSIGELFSFHPVEQPKEEGLDYEGYIRLLLALQPVAERTMRCMDMVEHTIRLTKNRPGFCLDSCVFAARAEFDCRLDPLFAGSGWSGGSFGTECTYSYYVP